jgi:hypothetical protein
MIRQWEKHETAVSESRLKPVSVYETIQQRPLLLVPPRVKEVLVTDALRVKEREYMQVRLQWKVKCQELKEQRRLLIEDNPLVTLPKLVLPPGPVFVALLKEEEVVALAQAAEKKKARWERLGKGLRGQALN